MVIHYAADYFPYGKILRSYQPCTSSPRFQTTHHERDQATGYDNRGARLYDAEIARFFGVDPLAQEFASWSGYNFVLGNPVKLIDPDGRSPQDPIYGTNPNNSPRWDFYRKFGNGVYHAAVAAGSPNGYKGLYLIAQKRQENGFGGAPGNNLFNIKGSGDPGSISYTTTEYVGGVAKTMTQTFAAYSTPQKGLEAQINLLESNFSDAFDALTNSDKTIGDYVDGLSSGKMGTFATDPNYKSQIKSIFNGIKNDYVKWFDYNISLNAMTMNKLGKHFYGMSYDEQEEVDKAKQDLSIANAKHAAEKEAVQNTQ